MGLWRRTYDDCVTAARRAPTLDVLLPQVRALAQRGHERWPSDSLDVPADVAGRRHYQRLRDVQRSFREVAYRTRLGAMDASGSPAGASGSSGRQDDLARAAYLQAERLLHDDNR